MTMKMCIASGLEPSRIGLFLVCGVLLGGCSLIENTVEAPFVALDHIVNGESNRDKIRELTSSNGDLERSNDDLRRENEDLAEKIGVLRQENVTLLEQGRAFEGLVSVFDSNPCFHVDRQGQFQVLIQPRLDERCIE